MPKHIFPIRSNPPEAMYPTTIQELSEFYGLTYQRVWYMVKEHLEFGIEVIISADTVIILPEGVLKLNHIRETDKERKKGKFLKRCKQIPLPERRKDYYGVEDFSSLERRIDKVKASLDKTFKKATKF